MKIERPQHARMSESGSSLLRLIQNHEAPVIDLLVRESIQNSLDASAASKPKSHVDVHFRMDDFEPLKLSRHFEGISHSLKRRFGENRQQFLSISDFGTVGLTGPMHFDQVSNNDFGNLLKLVYEISKAQEKQGAGGSWGLGKTVYFRVGIGLVLYYSRIKTKGGFESRLAACLVENEKAKDALLGVSGHLERGIAWWGQPYKDDFTVPLTDEAEIKEILDIFSISPYIGDQTGTTIIIPFISEEKLLSDTKSTYSDPGRNTRTYPWLESLDEYVKIAVQRWYAPRLMNRSYKFGSYLRAFVNDELISKDMMYPVFQVIQGLYNMTEAVASRSHEDILAQCGSEVHLENVSLNKVFKRGSKAGQIAFVKMSRKELRMDPPHNNRSPLVHLGRTQDAGENNPPIIAYTRQPGMIISYETVGPWVNRIPETPSNEFLIGVFVPNNSNSLLDEYSGISLEEYLRGSEQADHMSWSDYSVGSRRPGIIEKVQRSVSNKVQRAYKGQTANTNIRHLGGLSKALADALLPPEGFGRKPSITRKSTSGGSGKRVSRRGLHPTLRLLGSPKFEDGSVLTEFELSFGRKSTALELVAVAQTEGNVLSAEDWEDPGEIGTAFPISLTGLDIRRIETGKRQRPCEPIGFRLRNTGARKAEYEDVLMRIIHTGRRGVPYGVYIRVPEASGYTLQGVIELRSDDSMVMGGLKIIDRGEGLQ